MTIIDSLNQRYGNVTKLTDEQLQRAINNELDIAFSAKRIWLISSRRHEELIKEQSSRKECQG